MTSFLISFGVLTGMFLLVASLERIPRPAAHPELVAPPVVRDRPALVPRRGARRRPFDVHPSPRVREAGSARTLNPCRIAPDTDQLPPRGGLVRWRLLRRARRHAPLRHAVERAQGSPLVAPTRLPGHHPDPCVRTPPAQRARSTRALRGRLRARDRRHVGARHQRVRRAQPQQPSPAARMHRRIVRHPAAPSRAPRPRDIAQQLRHDIHLLGSRVRVDSANSTHPPEQPSAYPAKSRPTRSRLVGRFASPSGRSSPTDATPMHSRNTKTPPDSARISAHVGCRPGTCGCRDVQRDEQHGSGEAAQHSGPTHSSSVPSGSRKEAARRLGNADECLECEFCQFGLASLTVGHHCCSEGVRGEER